jgi:uroporphyrinogen-III synthase
MQVLITRPLEQAAETAAALAMMGHEAVISPVLEIVATGASWPSETIDCLIATSARAFEALSVAPDFPTLETRRLLPLFVVGETTLAATRKAGFFGPATVAPDVQGLVPLLLAHLRPGICGLYLAARARKPDLETACAEASTPLQVVETYRAVPATQLSDAARAALDEGSVSAALHYSRRSTAIFVELMEADGFDPASLTHVAISEDAAGPLRVLDLSRLRVRVAASPSESDMLDLLRDAQTAS